MDTVAINLDGSGAVATRAGHPVELTVTKNSETQFTVLGDIRVAKTGWVTSVPFKDGLPMVSVYFTESEGSVDVNLSSPIPEGRVVTLRFEVLTTHPYSDIPDEGGETL